mmetsp:Transcript_10510/g.29903  ORF Transcript_10510/g.29903 Transcript_10510/m.29903 type:complete len:213 (-) Transcript_10510:332-970(-)
MTPVVSMSFMAPSGKTTAFSALISRCRIPWLCSHFRDSSHFSRPRAAASMSLSIFSRTKQSRSHSPFSSTKSPMVVRLPSFTGTSTSIYSRCRWATWVLEPSRELRWAKALLSLCRSDMFPAPTEILTANSAPLSTALASRTSAKAPLPRGLTCSMSRCSLSFKAATTAVSVSSVTSSRMADHSLALGRKFGSMSISWAVALVRWTCLPGRR